MSRPTQANRVPASIFHKHLHSDAFRDVGRLRRRRHRLCFSLDHWVTSFDRRCSSGTDLNGYDQAFCRYSVSAAAMTGDTVSSRPAANARAAQRCPQIMGVFNGGHVWQPRPKRLHGTIRRRSPRPAIWLSSATRCDGRRRLREQKGSNGGRRVRQQ